MKLKYIIFLIILIVIGNFIRLKFEDYSIPNIEINEEVVYEKEEANKNNTLNIKQDINIVSYEDLLKLGFSKKQSEKIISYREFVGIISDLKELKRITRFGESGYNKAIKTLFVNNDNVLNSNKSNKKYNINDITTDEMKLLGFNKEEIKKITAIREKNEILSNLDIKDVFTEDRYNLLIERYIEF